MNSDLRPERKVVAAAIVTVAFYAIGLFVPEFNPPIGVEGATAVIVAYFVPNKKGV